MDGGSKSSWITNGTKGVDFAGNLELFDFATVHLCKSTTDSNYACVERKGILAILHRVAISKPYR